MLNEEADYHFKQGSYGLAAENYAKLTSRSFEEIALKFVSHNARDALMKYLVCKLKNISPKVFSIVLCVCCVLCCRCAVVCRFVCAAVLAWVGGEPRLLWLPLIG